MTVQTATDFFSQRSSEEKALLVAQLSLQLTIEGRKTYLEDSDRVSNTIRLRELNELQHLIAGYQVAVCKGMEHYPDELFLRMIIEHPDGGVIEAFEHIFSEAMHAFIAHPRHALKTA